MVSVVHTVGHTGQAELASGVRLARATAAGIRGATADRRLAVALSHSEREGSRARSETVDGWILDRRL